jgi:cytochrome b pre-mRNA-processing protein 3
MARAFYGRAKAYTEALAADDQVLAAALVRNLYRGQAPAGDTAVRMADYVRRQAAGLLGQPVEELLAGSVRFGPPP